MQENNYCVSVIIPVYNAEKYINKCIDSVLAQTLQNIEIILINDGSTDNSAIVLSQYAEKYNNIKVISQENKGASAARNEGLKVATGEFIGFVDADDYISSDMYKQLYDIAIDKNVDIVTSNFCYVKNDVIDKGVVNLPENRIIYQNEIRDLVCYANKNRLLWFAVKSIYRTSMIKENNIFYNTDVKIGTETPFVLECLLCAKSLYYVNVVNYFYVQSPNSITRTKYKSDLLNKLQNLYYAKKNVYIKYGITEYSDDLNNYTMEHTIPMLISNEINNSSKFFELMKLYSKIRNSEMVSEAYKNSSIKLVKNKLKYLVLLLKYRLYFLILIFTKLFL